MYYYYLVVNNAFNRRYYPHFIGRRFLNPPLYPSERVERVARPVQVRRIRRPNR